MSASGDVVLEARSEPFPYTETFRLIHKYYLPLELRKRIRLNDIEAIADGFDEVEGPPEPVPGVILHYEDIDAERRLDGRTVAAVWAAHKSFREDERAIPTPAQVESILALNRRLETIERKARADCARIRDELKQCSECDDHEMTLLMSFYLRDDDPQGGEKADWDPHLNEYNERLCQRRYCGGALSGWELDQFGIGDDHNHDTLGPHQPALLHQVRHTWVLHDLYEHVGIPLKHLGRIGEIWEEVVVQHQRFHQ